MANQITTNVRSALIGRALKEDLRSGFIGDRSAAVGVPGKSRTGSNPGIWAHIKSMFWRGVESVFTTGESRSDMALRHATQDFSRQLGKTLDLLDAVEDVKHKGAETLTECLKDLQGKCTTVCSFNSASPNSDVKAQSTKLMVEALAFHLKNAPLDAVHKLSGNIDNAYPGLKDDAQGTAKILSHALVKHADKTRANTASVAVVNCLTSMHDSSALRAVQSMVQHLELKLPGQDTMAEWSNRAKKDGHFENMASMFSACSDEQWDELASAGQTAKLPALLESLDDRLKGLDRADPLTRAVRQTLYSTNLLIDTMKAAAGKSVSLEAKVLLKTLDTPVAFPGLGYLVDDDLGLAPRASQFEITLPAEFNIKNNFGSGTTEKCGDVEVDTDFIHDVERAGIQINHQHFQELGPVIEGLKELTKNNPQQRHQIAAISRAASQSLGVEFNKALINSGALELDETNTAKVLEILSKETVENLPTNLSLSFNQQPSYSHHLTRMEDGSVRLRTSMTIAALNNMQSLEKHPGNPPSPFALVEFDPRHSFFHARTEFNISSAGKITESPPATVFFKGVVIDAIRYF